MKQWKISAYSENHVKIIKSFVSHFDSSEQ